MNDIRWLNETVKVTLARSQIHGIGVFAIRDIKKGEKLYCKEFERRPVKIPYANFNKLRKEIRTLILQRWPVVRKERHFLSPNHDVLLMSFLNHSDNPNYDKVTDRALRKIKKGEEVTENYGEFRDIINL